MLRAGHRVDERPDHAHADGVGVPALAPDVVPSAALVRVPVVTDQEVIADVVEGAAVDVVGLDIVDLREERDKELVTDRRSPSKTGIGKSRKRRKFFFYGLFR